MALVLTVISPQEHLQIGLYTGVKLQPALTEIKTAFNLKTDLNGTKYDTSYPLEGLTSILIFWRGFFFKMADTVRSAC